MMLILEASCCPIGRVYCVPGDATQARIYNPVSDTTTVANGTFPGGDAYAGGVLLSDGRVYCVPRFATQARIYDPVNDTTTVANGTFPGDGACGGGVLLPDGRVFCVPGSVIQPRIYDPVNDATTRSKWHVSWQYGSLWRCLAA